jgi:hypothetical protein
MHDGGERPSSKLELALRRINTLKLITFVGVFSHALKEN